MYESMALSRRPAHEMLLSPGCDEDLLCESMAAFVQLPPRTSVEVARLSSASVFLLTKAFLPSAMCGGSPLLTLTPTPGEMKIPFYTKLDRSSCTMTSRIVLQTFLLYLPGKV